MDIALIQLLEDIDFSKTEVRPACLPVPQSDTEGPDAKFAVPLLGKDELVTDATFEKLGTLAL